MHDIYTEAFMFIYALQFRYTHLRNFNFENAPVPLSCVHFPPTPQRPRRVLDQTVCPAHLDGEQCTSAYKSWRQGFYRLDGLADVARRTLATNLPTVGSTRRLVDAPKFFPGQRHEQRKTSWPVQRGNQGNHLRGLEGNPEQLRSFLVLDVTL